MHRHALDPVVITTLPHLASLWLVIATGHTFYAAIIAASSALSVAWHLHREERDLLFWLDYAFALVCAFADVCLAASADCLGAVVCLNLLTVGAN